MLVSLVSSVLGDIVSALISLAFLVPSLAVGARRLHDIGKTGWLQLLWIVPFIGWAIMIYWAVQPSHAASNDYGDAPAATGGIALAPGQQ